VTAARTIVVKIGSSSVTTPSGGIDERTLAKLAAEVAAQRTGGRRVVVVTSGAVAAGWTALAEDAERPGDLATLQAVSAVGQHHLMRAWSQAFEATGLLVGQVLLAPLDFVHRGQYLRARGTLERLLELGVVPVVNENDAVADAELRFGDNDRLAALVAHLVGADKATLASPRSYNNRAGLSRTVNEHLLAGTEVLVAEMGAYGPGEIAALCSWMSPQVAVITAIGPAHLERFKSLERTLAAKAEITSRARVTVLNVDDERLAGLASRLEAEGKRVVRASGSNSSADVAVLAVSGGLELRLAGKLVGVEPVAAAERPTATSNVACAVAVALELGLDPKSLLPRLGTLPVPANRLQRYVAGGGFVVLDDTFNSNPAGARLALARLAVEAPDGRRVLVTPGMVELGRTQREENAALGEACAAVASDLVIVGRTNRRALASGAGRGDGRLSVVVVDRLGEAVAWVRERLGPGDAVLYENDLPDHFP